MSGAWDRHCRERMSARGDRCTAQGHDILAVFAAVLAISGVIMCWDVWAVLVLKPDVRVVFFLGWVGGS